MHDGPPETASTKQSIKGSLCHESRPKTKEPVIDLRRKRGVSAVFVLPIETATKITSSASQYFFRVTRGRPGSKQCPIAPISSLGLSRHLSIDLLVRMHATDHFFPRGWMPAGMFPKPRTVESSIAEEAFVARDLPAEAVNAIDHLQ
jgi:hypothetical protein